MTTLNKQVSESAGDAREASGTVVIDGVSITLSAAAHWHGAFFSLAGGYPPAGAAINTATYQIYINATANDNVHGDFYLETGSSIGLFTTDTNNLSGRARTANKTTLAANNVGAGWYSIDVASALQEAVNSVGYNGNIVILWDCNASTDCILRAWDYSDHSLAPKLDIEYTVAAASFVPPRRPRTYVRM